MNKEKILLGCVTVGMLLIAAAILIPIIAVMRTGYLESQTFKYLFAAGALLALIGRVFNQYQGRNQRLRRLVRIEAWGALFFCVAAVFLFYPPTPNPLGNLRDALAFTLAGGAIQIFTSIMIPRVAKKEPEEEPAETAKKKRKKK